MNGLAVNQHCPWASDEWTACHDFPPGWAYPIVWYATVPLLEDNDVHVPVMQPPFEVTQFAVHPEGCFVVTVSDLEPDVGDIVVQLEVGHIEGIYYHYVENSDFVDLGNFGIKKERGCGLSRLPFSSWLYLAYAVMSIAWLVSLELLMLAVAERVALLIQWCVADIAVWYIEYIIHYLKNWGFLILGNKKEGVNPAVVFMSTLLV